MTTKNRKSVQRARDRALGKRDIERHLMKMRSERQCRNEHCGCGHEDCSRCCADNNFPEHEVKRLIAQFVTDLGLVDESKVKLLFEICFAENAITEEEIKKIVLSLVKTEAQIKQIITECFLEFGLVNATTIKEMIERCISEIQFPTPEPPVSDSHIKLVALNCVLEYIPSDEKIKSMIEECGLSLADVRMEIVKYLAENPGLTECQVELIFERCIKGLIPTADDIRCVFVSCLSEWGIAPECIKDYIRNQILECLPRPITMEDVNAYIFSCYSDQLHTKDQIKVISLQCFNDLEFNNWTEGELNCLIEAKVRTDAQLKLFIQNCVEIPSQALIESYAENVFSALIQEALSGVIDEDKVKILLLGCLKDLGIQQAVETVNFSADCDENGLVTLQIEVNGVTESAELNLSKFLGGSGLTLQQVAEYVEEQNYLQQTALDEFCDAVEVEIEQGNGSLEVKLQTPCGEKSDSTPLNFATLQQIQSIQEQLDSLQLCIDGVSVNFDPATRSLSIFIQDACGNKSDSALIPAGDSTSGITAIEAKTLFDNCFSDQAPSLCNDSVSASLQGTQISFSVTDSCGTKSDQVDVSDLILDPSEACVSSVEHELQGTSLVTTVTDQCGAKTDSIDLSLILPGVNAYCLTGILQEQAGQVVTLRFLQENCSPQEVSFTVGNSEEASVECCNTAAIGDVDVENKTATVTIAQSVGADVTATLDLAPLLNSLVESEVLTAEDGCSEYRSVKFCGVEIGPFPIFEPKKNCKCLSVPAGFSGQVSVGLLQPGTTQTIDWGDGSSLESGPSGTQITHNFTASEFNRAITICNQDACDETIYNITQSGLPADSSCGCCDC